MVVDCFQLLFAPLSDVLKNEGPEFPEELQNFEVVLLDRHFEIQSDELAHVSVGERVLSSEDWADFKDSLEVTHNTHLLVKLGRLGQTSLPVEILELEDVGASFRAPSDHLGSMDFYKVVLEQELPEKLTDGGGNPEDGLFGLGAKIDDSVVQSGLHLDDGLLFLLLALLCLLSLFGLLFFLFILLVVKLIALNFSAGVGDLQRQSGHSPVDHKEFHDFKLNLLSATFDRFFWFFDDSGEINNTLIRNSSHIFDHVLGDLLALESDSLDGGEPFPEDEEAAVTLLPDSVDSGPDEDFLSFEVSVDVLEIGPFPL